ncbi:MAG: hypothetical protein Q8M22_00140 [Actinomycetota bacterium]|nr:hypothetical protein [Actinomycetota bacterium]
MQTTTEEPVRTTENPSRLQPDQARAVRLGVSGAVLAIVALGLLGAYSLPLFSLPDEPAHYGYAAEVADGRLPHIEDLVPVDGIAPLEELMNDRDEVRRTIWTANHPPLFYVIEAVPIGIGRATDRELGAMHAGRVLVVLIAGGAVVAVAWLTRLLVPRRPVVAVVAAGVAALLPAMINTSSYLYNDSLAVLTSTLAFGAGVLWLVRGPSTPRLAFAAVTCALAASTRASGLLVVGVVGLAVLIGSVIHAAADRGERPASRATRAVSLLAPAAVVGAAVVATSGWFWVRSVDLYGDLTATGYLLERFDRVPRRPTTWYVSSIDFWSTQQRLLWGVGSNHAINTESVTHHFWVLALPPIAGLVLAARHALRTSVRRSGSLQASLDGWRHWVNHGDPRRLALPAAWVLGLVFLLLLELSVMQFTSQGGGTHVRYVLPGIGIASAAAAVGLLALPGARRGVTAVAFLVVTAVAYVWGLRAQLAALLADTDADTSILRGLELAGVRAPLLMLVLVGAAVLAGLVLQAVAVWRLTAGWAPAADEVSRRSDSSCDEA